MNTAIIANESANIELYNKNLEACLKPTYNLTGTMYTNVCTGEISKVPNGTLDYFFLIVFVVGIAFLGRLFYKMLNN